MRYITSSHILNKRFLVISLVFLTASIFRVPLIEKFDIWLVDTLFSKITTNFFNDIVLLVLLLILAALTYFGLNKKILLNPGWTVYCLAFIIIYLYYRTTDRHFSFVPFANFDALKYADFLLLLALAIISVITYQFFFKDNEPVYLDKPFLLDVPIITSEQDLLNRAKFAHRIAEKIQSRPKVNRPGALAVGITGEWGAGKTSFSNMINEALDVKNRIVIHFNPWRSSSPAKIIEDFFELLIAELGRFDSELSDNIYSYAKTLTKIDENIFTKGLQTISELFESSNKNEIYDSINDSISATKKQIIIFIDDLDRLDKKEIAEVLRIIRNTANFNNLVYVVSYDQNYVLEAVKSFNSANYVSFLEKIFQFEFVLPMYEAAVIRDYLKKLLADGLSAYLHPQINSIVDARTQNGINFTNEIISTHRAAIRLANSIIFEIEGLEHEVLFYDFYLLQLLKCRYPLIFKNLFEHSAIFFITDFKNNDRFSRLREQHEKFTDTQRLEFLRMMDLLDEKNRDLKKEDKETILAIWLKGLVNEKVISENDERIIQAILAELLNTERDMGEDKNLKYLAFARESNFYKYFAFELLNGDISSREFEDSRRGNFEDYMQKINEWSQQNKGSAFLDKLLKIDTFHTRQEFENHLKTLFHVGRGYAANNNFYGFDLLYLLKIIELPLEQLKKGLNELYETREEYEQFIRSEFESAPDPKAFETHLLRVVLDRFYDFPLSKKEVADKTFQNFKSYVERIGIIDSGFWNMFHNVREWDEENQRALKSNEAKQIAVQLWKRTFDPCKLGSFIMQTSPESEYFHLDPERWGFYFATQEELEEWLTTSENVNKLNECYLEFLTFLHAYNEVKPRGLMFDFKHLSPDRWR